jgi:phosphonate transport system ATP-binding protein
MIQLRQVEVVYPGGFIGLHSTTIDFRRGEFAVLLGASGAGKSTLLRCLNLLNKPSSGTVEVSGLGLLVDRGLTQRHRRQTGMIFQQHQLIGRHSVLENVLLGRIGYHSTLRSLFPLPRADRAFALECLERVGLLDKALERVDQLSGGQQQRVGIARALAQRPRLVLADEPVASLDPASAEKILELLRGVCKQDGITAILSLHQVELAQAYADRIIGLSHGAVVFDGVPQNLTPAYLAQLYDQASRPPGSTADFTNLTRTSFNLITAKEPL